MRVNFLALSILAHLALYNASTLTMKEECGGYQSYIIKDDGNSLELGRNIGVNTKRDAKYELQTDKIGTRSRCNDITIGTQTFTFTRELVLEYYDPEGYTIRVVAPLTEPLTIVSETEVISQVLELLNKPGYIGNVWLGYDDVKEIVLNNSISVIADAYNTDKFDCPTATPLEHEQIRINCVFDGFAVDDFFLNDISYNWALWLMIFYMLAFFFIALCFDDNVPLDYVAESNWTLHPCVSIYTRGSEIYTKQSRFAQYFFFMNSLSFFTAVMHLRWWDKHLAIRLLVFPVFGTMFALITTFITGILLNITYKIHWEFINGYKIAENHEQKKQNLDNYERRSFKATYVFYSVLLFGSAHFTIWPIYFMQDLPLTTQGFWILGIIIGVCMDLLGWRIIMVYMARFEVLKKLFKIWGYYYDQRIHEEYSAIVGYKM